MKDLNNVTVTGRVVRTAETKVLASGDLLAKTSLAISRPHKVKEEWTNETTFIDITLWGKNAEHFVEKVEKGDLIIVEASIHQNKWITPEGENRSKIGFNVNSFTKIPLPRKQPEF